MSNGVSRRGFLAGAATAAAAATVPVEVLLRAARLASAASAHFFTAAEYATCDALCARVLPGAGGPGAAEARAVDFIDLFLAAFTLPHSVADGPLIYLSGPYSGRNAYPDPETGQPSSHRPPNQLVVGGARHTLPLTRAQEVSWRAQLYGSSVIVDDASLPAAYRDAVRRGLIPIPPPLRDTYRAGLAAYDRLSQSLHGVTFASASTADQDAMLVSTASGGSLGAPSSSAAASVPAEAKTLYPILVNHTLQACFALPEYGSNRNGAMWGVVGWDGDTQPLGNSIYETRLTDAELGDAQGHNTGFGDPAVYTPRGGYREFRPVSTPDPGADNPDIERALAAIFGLPS